MQREELCLISLQQVLTTEVSTRDVQISGYGTVPILQESLIPGPLQGKESMQDLGSVHNNRS